MEYKLLGNIKSPSDIKKFNNEQLNCLCEELRNEIIETTSKNGGHLASNLGAVELTVALHRSFDTPKDAIIFDVGHQSYAHKLLTGRFDSFKTIRKKDGLSGFMRPDESEHDAFITGHSSNSISAAYGIYKAKKILGEDGTAVAVIGDGALTGGMAYEALNNAGSGRSNFIIVLNDNKMSISRNVGALARSLTKMRNKPKYHHVKLVISNVLSAIPLIGEPLSKFVVRVKEVLKTVVYRDNIFTSMGFNYLGPVDGHNIALMEELFNIAKSYQRPSVIHIITTKGKGYSYAETSPKSYHGVSPFDIEMGAEDSGKATFSDIAGGALCELARSDDKVCAITAAMASGTGLTNFAALYKSRFFDVGIAEEHATTFCAGLAKGGVKPYFAVYSSFLQRGIDQVIHDAAILSLPIKLLVDRAGIVGEDGETHQGIFDVALLSAIPNMTIYSPCYFSELKALIEKSADFNSPLAIRYPRGAEKPNENYRFDDSDYTVFGNGGKSAIITYGRIFSNALEAQSKLENVDLIKLNKIYPINEDLAEKLSKYKNLHFFEEGILNGGIGEHLLNKLNEKGFKGKYNIHAIEEFVPAAKVDEALKSYKLDALSITEFFK